MNSESGVDASMDNVRELRAYVNERGVSVPAGSTALDAVRAHSPTLADEVAAGAARLTDSRGLPIDANQLATGGLILRVLPVRAPSQTEQGRESE
jgi:hypothetical protein